MNTSWPKECVIENGLYSWILHVDGVVILFHGNAAADYFKEHYKKLGYEVKPIETWQNAIRKPNDER